MKSKLHLISLGLILVILFSSCSEIDNSSSSNYSESGFDSSSNTDSASATDSNSNSSGDTSDSSNGDPLKIDLVNFVLTSEGEDEEGRFGIVSWNADARVDYFEYQIETNDTQNTSSTTMKLHYGETIVARAIAKSEYQDSDWSMPFTYYGNPQSEDLVTQIPNQGYVWVAYKGATISPFQIQCGQNIIQPSTPSKEYHLFNGWFADPYLTESFDFSQPVFRNTTIYASWIKASFIDNVSYWLKVNPKITSQVQSPKSNAADWTFVPLYSYYDDVKKINTFRTEIAVSESSVADPAKLLAMDGFDDLEGRSYWKNGTTNFEITSDGRYRVTFSLQTQWQSSTGTAVHLLIEKMSNSSALTSTTTHTANLTLARPEVHLLNQDGVAYFSPIEGADYYEYSINNAAIVTTLSTEIELPVYSYIVVRACSNADEKQYSSWSRAVVRPRIELINPPEDMYASVFFYGIDAPSYLVLKGTTLVQPVAPSKADYIFAGFYTTARYSIAFDFSSPILQDTIIYVKWDIEGSLNSKIYFDIVDSLDNVLGGFKINQSNLNYVEYFATFTSPFTNFVFHIVKHTDHDVRYGPYTLAAKTTFSMYFSEDYMWDNGTENASHLYVGRFNIYFTNVPHWTIVNYYTWNSGTGVYRNSWPGIETSFVKTNSYGQNIYVVSLNLTRYNRLIFNDGGSNQTISINLDDFVNNTGFYTTSKDSNGKYLVSSYAYT